MKMDWTLFTKAMPPEKSYVLVGNGPAVNKYYFTTEQYEGQIKCDATIVLWELTGQRHEVKIADLLQWCHQAGEDKKLDKMCVQLSWWKRFMKWCGISGGLI